jgi:hypothetical protein
MSLTVNGESAPSIAPVEEGTHLGVCSMLIDLGMQYSEVYKKSQRKVLIGWELPDETIEIDGEMKPRVLSKRYTANLSEKSNLRKDLASWRGRDFTPDELKAFDLKNIVGASCLLTIIHSKNGEKTYANIQSVVKLPKGMAKQALSEPPVVFDLDTDPLERVEDMPAWIAELIKKSETYQARITPPVTAANNQPVPDGNTFQELSDDAGGELPF